MSVNQIWLTTFVYVLESDHKTNKKNLFWGLLVGLVLYVQFSSVIKVQCSNTLEFSATAQACRWQQFKYSHLHFYLDRDIITLVF